MELDKKFLSIDFIPGNNENSLNNSNISMRYNNSSFELNENEKLKKVDTITNIKGGFNQFTLSPKSKDSLRNSVYSYSFCNSSNRVIN